MAENVLDILLANEPPKAKEEEIKIKRLSEEWGTDVIFKIKALGYNKVAELKAMGGDEMPVHIALAGVKEPDFKSKELKAKYNADIPTDVIKKLLTPGEIEDISREIERLSGYRQNTIEEIKKK